MNDISRDAAAGRVYLDAVLHPHRSLNPFGFRMLMLIVGASMLIIGVLFLVSGAWPVFGFCGAEFLLLYGAFQLNFRAARRYERVLLTEDRLEVRRFSPRGEVGRWNFEPTWLQVSMDDSPRRDNQLILRSHGRSLIIGSFLTPDERRDFARALHLAIGSWRERWNSNPAT
jgi:uncharacterized membrane protein